MLPSASETTPTNGFQKRSHHKLAGLVVCSWLSVSSLHDMVHEQRLTQSDTPIRSSIFSTFLKVSHFLERQQIPNVGRKRSDQLRLATLIFTCNHKAYMQHDARLDKVIKCHLTATLAVKLSDQEIVESVRQTIS